MPPPTDLFKECDNCPEMIVVPSGSFIMGSPSNEDERDSDEGPQHNVSISGPFAVGRFSVTFEEMEACAADDQCDRRFAANSPVPVVSNPALRDIFKELVKANNPDQGWGCGRMPVIYVGYEDAMSYVAWLSHKTGRPYRLLSEAEREYVTRAGTATPFWWGSSISTSQANYSEGRGEFRARTVPVDSFQPNPWGLYQVHGNVWEWVADCYHDTYAGAPSDGSAWTSGDCSRHVLRGGAWDMGPRSLRSANRNKFTSGPSVSFRVARTLTPLAAPDSNREQRTGKGRTMGLLGAVLALVLLTANAHAEKRVALVIGNAAYRNVSPLLNPRNDANDIAASLTRLNFSVRTLIDGTFDDMRRALRQFGREAMLAEDVRDLQSWSNHNRWCYRAGGFSVFRFARL